MDEQRGPAAAPPRRTWLHRLDEVVYSAEQTVVVGSLVAMTIMVFLDVVHRRLDAPESRLIELLAFFVNDPSTLKTLHTMAAPPLLVALTWLLVHLGIGATTELPKGKHWGTSVAVTVALVALGIAMLHVPSSLVYALLYVVGIGGWVHHLLREKPEKWQAKLIAAFIMSVPILFVCFTVLPEGYSWAKELSLLLLLWVGFIGASLCAYEGKHLRMEAFERLVPPKLEKRVRATGQFATAGLCLFMAVLGYNYTFAGEFSAFNLGGYFEQTGIPGWTSIAAVPVAFGVTTLRYVAAGVSTLKGGHYGSPAEDESLAKAEELRGAIESAKDGAKA